MFAHFVVYIHFVKCSIVLSYLFSVGIFIYLLICEKFMYLRSPSFFFLFAMYYLFIHECFFRTQSLFYAVKSFFY